MSASSDAFGTETELRRDLGLGTANRYVAWWERLAERYRGRDYVAGYDLLNEPVANAPTSGGFDKARYVPGWKALNGLYRRTVAAIRAIDPDHIIFLEGEGYSERFEGLEPPFAGNLVYSLHHYTKAGFGPGPYRGSVEQVRRDFRATEGARFAERHGVPLWVGEFGAVYNGPAGEIDDRLQALDDQIEMLESEGVHWTLWTYKDCGVLGWVTLDPESPYMRITRELRAAKLALDTDFWLHWLPAPPFRRERNALARSILELSGSDVSPEAHETHVGLALSTYAGALLQPVFAALFRGVSDQELDKALASFSLEQCRPNTRLLERIRRFMKPE